MELTRNTKIRLSKIIDLRDWCGYLQDAKEWDEDKHPRGQPENAGQFAKTFCGNLKENQKDLQKTFDKANIPQEEKQALKNYTSGMSKEINEYCRNPTEMKSEIEKQIKLLDSALNRATLDKNIKTYRTVIVDKAGLEKLFKIKGLEQVEDSKMQDFLDKHLKLNGLQIQDKGYLSTTIDKNYSHKKRNANQRKNKYLVKYQINAPEEAHGLYVESITAYPKLV